MSRPTASFDTLFAVCQSGSFSGSYGAISGSGCPWVCCAGGRVPAHRLVVVRIKVDKVPKMM